MGYIIIISILILKIFQSKKITHINSDVREIIYIYTKNAQCYWNILLLVVCMRSDSNMKKKQLTKCRKYLAKSCGKRICTLSTRGEFLSTF
jgi:hypothetical protein